MFAYCGNNPANYYDPFGNFRIQQDACYSYLGDNGSCGGGGAIIYAIGGLIELSKEILSFGTIAIAISTTLDSTKDRGNNYVYVLVDQNNKVQYVGRTKNPAARESAHKRNPFRKGLTFNVVGSRLNYNQARGLEQVLMLYYHTVDTQNHQNNQINGIGLNNDFVDRYINAAQGALGYVWNQLSNEVLNWLGK